jgi:hypothetical protein
MDTSKRKSYAPRARTAVTARAALYGITQAGVALMQQQGDLVVINGEAYPRELGDQRNKLAERIQRQGFDQTLEAIAYTWFNRLVAIRYMELHGYLFMGVGCWGEGLGMRGQGLGTRG